MSPFKGVEWGFVSLYGGGMGVCLPLLGWNVDLSPLKGVELVVVVVGWGGGGLPLRGWNGGSPFMGVEWGFVSLYGGGMGVCLLLWGCNGGLSPFMGVECGFVPL